MRSAPAISTFPFRCLQINPKQCRIIYEILRLRCTNVNDESEYKAYRLDVKKRLNANYHKQLSDLKKLEKAGQDLNLISAGIATPQERIEQLKQEYKVRSIGIKSFTVFGEKFQIFNFFCRNSKKNTNGLSTKWIDSLQML